MFLQIENNCFNQLTSGINLYEQSNFFAVVYSYQFDKKNLINII